MLLKQTSKLLSPKINFIGFFQLNNTNKNNNNHNNYNNKLIQNRNFFNSSKQSQNEQFQADSFLLEEELDSEIKEVGSSSLIKPQKGGRSSVSGIIATVFGGNGFLGRNIVNRLGKLGSTVIIPYRGTEKVIRDLKVMGDLGQIVTLPFDIRNQESIEQALLHSNVVINCLGSWWETRNFNFELSNVESAKRISEAAKKMGVERMIHVSSLGVSKDSKSDWAKSKALGELEVIKNFPEATILRPSEVYGYYDRFLMNYANLLRFHPAFPLPTPGRLIQPLFVKDFTNAVMECISNPKDTSSQSYDLAGTEVFSHKEFIDHIGEILEIPAKHAIPLPYPITKFATQYFYSKWKSFPPFITEQLEWYHQDGDNLLPSHTQSFAELGLDDSLHKFDDVALSMIQLFQLPKNRFLV